MNATNIVLVYEDSGVPVKIGDKVKDFRGGKAVVAAIEPPRHSGSTGRVHVREGSDDFINTYYPGVYGMHWVDRRSLLRGIKGGKGNPRTCACGRQATRVLRSVKEPQGIAYVCPRCLKKYSDPKFVAQGPISKLQRNPRGVLIYGKVNRIIATKTQKHICDATCKSHGHRYYHDFSSRAQMYGLPDGSLLIKSK
jgi:hypothetical protein